MGCDIHGFAQHRYSFWSSAFKNVARVPNGRNYTLFALLAGVRNYDNVTPFAEPRGLPKDLILNRDRNDDSYDSDPNYYFSDVGDHSHTHMTLAELRAWTGWDQTVARTRILDRAEYERIQAEGGAPKTWAGDVWGQKVIKVDVADVVAGTAPADWTHVWYTWDVAVREECTHFLQWLEWLYAEYCWSDEGAENIRFIIGFDS